MPPRIEDLINARNDIRSYILEIEDDLAHSLASSKSNRDYCAWEQHFRQCLDRAMKGPQVVKEKPVKAEVSKVKEETG